MAEEAGTAGLLPALLSAARRQKSEAAAGAAARALRALLDGPGPGAARNGGRLMGVPGEWAPRTRCCALHKRVGAEWVSMEVGIVQQAALGLPQGVHHRTQHTHPSYQARSRCWWICWGRRPLR